MRFSSLSARYQELKSTAKGGKRGSHIAGIVLTIGVTLLLRGKADFRRLTDQVHNNVIGELVRGQSDPGHDHSDCIVDHLNVEEENADGIVSRLVHSAKVRQRIQGGSEKTVQPSPSLTQ